MQFIRLIGLWVILGSSVDGWSQQMDHFIYLQSDTKQPFYVKMDASGSPLASSSTGYLILPKVPQGQFSFWVGFPDNAYPQQHFLCAIAGDKGYLLKRFPEKGWALYDLQELTLTYASADSAAVGRIADTVGQAHTQPAVLPPTTQVSTQTSVPSAPAQTPVSVADTAKPDAFGDLLVAVTKDSTLKNIKAVKKAPPPVPVPTPVVVTPSATTTASIVLVSKQVTDTGVQLVYTDRQASGVVDTVQVLLPSGTVGTQVDSLSGAGLAAKNPTSENAPPGTRPDSPVTVVPKDTASTAAQVPAQPAVQPVVQPVVQVDTTHAFNPASVIRPGKAKDTSNYVVPVFKAGAQDPADSAKTQALAAGFGVQQTVQTPPAASPGSAPAPQGVMIANSNCTHVATDDDYLKLRRRMASESDVDRMIELARKAFRKSCFTTDQARNLSFLFREEDGRYKFIEEIYPFVSDSWNFKTLQSLFSSVYFINRFKALVQR